MSNNTNNKSPKSKKIILSKIEDKVDKIILKNKEKLTSLHLNKLDIEKFSLKNKDKNTVFYLRKKNKTKTKDSKDNNLKDNKKSTENKINQDKKATDIKTQKNQYFKEKNKEIDKKESLELFKAQSKPSTLRDLVDSEDFDMVVSDINTLIDKESESDINKKKEKSAEDEKIEKYPQKNNFSDFEKSPKDLVKSDITPYPTGEIKNREKQKSNWKEKRERKKELKAKNKELKEKKDRFAKRSWDKELSNGLKEDVGVADKVEENIRDDFVISDEGKNSVVSQVDDVGVKFKRDSKKELKAREKELKIRERELRARAKKANKSKKKELKLHRKELKARKKEPRPKKNKPEISDKRIKTEVKEKLPDDFDVYDREEDSRVISERKDVKIEDKKVTGAELKLNEDKLKALKQKYGSKFVDDSIKEDLTVTDKVDIESKEKDDVIETDVVKIKDTDIVYKKREEISSEKIKIEKVEGADVFSKRKDFVKKDKDLEQKEKKLKEKKPESFKGKYESKVKDDSLKDNFVVIDEIEEVFDKEIDETGKEDVSEVDDVVVGEVEGEVSDDFVVLDEEKDSVVSEVEDVGVKVKRDSKKELRARERELKAQEKELRLKEKRIKKAKDKELRLKEKKAKRAKRDKDKEKELKVKSRKPKFLKKEVKPGSEDVVVKEEVPISDDISTGEVSEVDDVVVGEVEGEVSDDFVVLDEEKDSVVSEVEDVGVKVKRDSKKELRARERELKAQEKELRLKEKRIKKAKDKELRLKEKKAKRAKRDKDKEKELKVKSRKPKFLKKEVKPGSEDVVVKEEVPISDDISTGEVSEVDDVVVGEVEGEVSDDFVVLDEEKDSVVSEVEDVGVKVKRDSKKELRARERELKAQEKELRLKEKRIKKAKDKELRLKEKKAKRAKRDKDKEKELKVKSRKPKFLKKEVKPGSEDVVVKEEVPISDDISTGEVSEVDDVVVGEVEGEVSDDFVVLDEEKDSVVSEVEDVGVKVKRDSKKELRARERELKAQEKELRLKEKRIKKAKDKELRLKEKKAKRAKRDKDKEKELKVKSRKPKFLKKEVKPGSEDVVVKEEVPISDEPEKPEIGYTAEDVIGLDKKKTKTKKKKIEPKKDELVATDEVTASELKKDTSGKVKIKGKGLFSFLLKKLLKPKSQDKDITVIFGDVKVVDETKDAGAGDKFVKTSKKELKAHKKELRVQRKELKSKKKKVSDEKEVSEKKDQIDTDRKLIIPIPEGKDIVGVSRKGSFFKRKKSGFVGSDLDGEDLDKDVVGVSGGVVVVDEIEDIGVVSKTKTRRGLSFGKKVDGTVGVDRKLSRADKKKLRDEKKQLKTKVKQIKVRDKKVVSKGKGFLSLGKKEEIPIPKGKDIVGVSRKGSFFKRKKSGFVDSDLDGEDLDKDVVGVSGDVVVVDESIEPSVQQTIKEVGFAKRFKRAGKKELKTEEKKVSFKDGRIKTKERLLGLGKKDFRPKPKGKDVVGETKKGLLGGKKPGVTDSGKDEEILKKTTITPMFRIDNITHSEIVSKDEKKLLDNKIKVFAEKGKTDDKDKEIASKAIELATEHIKEKKMKVPKQLKTEKGVKQEETKGPTITTGEYVKDNYDEHLFFDEEETTDKGWSPKLTKTDKDDALAQGFQQTGMPSETMDDLGYLELPEDVLRTDSSKLSDLGFSTNQWEELDFYSLNEPFAYVEILREKDTLDKCYFLVEIALSDEEEKTLAFIKETISNMSFNIDELEEKGYEKYLLEKLDQVIKEYNLLIGEESRKKIFYYIGKSSLGLGRLDPLMKDPNIEDISCDGSNVPLFLYHRKFGSLKSNVHFNNEEELSSFVHRLAQKCGKQISIAEPMLDATMPDGSRIQMTLSDEITAKGSTFTIRKFRSDPFSPPDIVEFNTMSSEMVAYMWLAIENGVNTLFAGGTASGKTTALNAISLFIPRESKIVSIEETREINLPHPNWIPGVARSGFGEVVGGKVIGEIDLYDLMKAALRQRPEYILVGEIRGKEAYVLFQAMATGHATYSTVHADSAQSLIHRLEGKPINIPRVMLQSLDVVCLHVITRVKNMRARRCKQIIEIIDIDPTTKEILTNEVFRWDPVEDKFIYSGKSYVLERVRGEKDMTREDMTQEIKRRQKIIEWMNKTNVREFRGVAKIVSQYGENPDEVMQRVEKVVKKNEK